jgi:phage replication O-like protein O
MNEGGFLRMPNDWIDRAMPSMSAAEWMVTTVILRQTIGWNKDRDAISLTQFEQKTGLSRHTIIDAIRKLAKRGWIRVYEQGIRSVYEPSFEAGAISAPMDTSAETAPALVQKLHQTSAESAPEVVQKLHTQKTRKTKTKTDKDTKVHDALRARVPDESTNHSGDANKKVSKASRATLSTEEQARHKELFDAVAQVCVLDAKMNGGIIARTAKQLRTGDAAAHAADVHAFLEWWKTSDFRGRQGSPPTPFQLTGSWKKFRDGYADIPKPTDNRQTKKPQITDMLSMLGGIYKEKNGN